ncbi:Uncharacterised protein [Listeria monocytogenes]|nr:Uncharacterised protein [Listeria monocytogenes]CWW58412.1 Uncharacterised protein [Listeria monocytogenes]
MLQNNLKVSITNIASTAAKNIAKAMNVEQPESHMFTVINRYKLTLMLLILRFIICKENILVPSFVILMKMKWRS